MRDRFLDEDLQQSLLDLYSEHVMHVPVLSSFCNWLLGCLFLFFKYLKTVFLYKHHFTSLQFLRSKVSLRGCAALSFLSLPSSMCQNLTFTWPDHQTNKNHIHIHFLLFNYKYFLDIINRMYLFKEKTVRKFQIPVALLSPLTLEQFLNHSCVSQGFLLHFNINLLTFFFFITVCIYSLFLQRDGCVLEPS